MTEAICMMESILVVEATYLIHSATLFFISILLHLTGSLDASKTEKVFVLGRETSSRR